MKKFFIWTFASLVVLIFGAAALLPSFLSTPFGKNTAVSWINGHIPGKIEVEDLQLSWLGKQKFKNFSLKDESGKKIASFEHLETNTSLAYLLLGGRTFNSLVLKSPYLFLEQAEKEASTNVDKAIGKKRKKGSKKKKNLNPFYAHTASIEKGTFVFLMPMAKPISITDLYLEKQKKPNTLTLTARTKQDLIEGNVAVRAVCDKNFKINAEIQNFPIALLDEISGRTLYEEAIGKTLNVSLDCSRQKNSLSINVNAQSPNLKAVLKGETEDKKLHLNPDSQFKFTITPGFFNQIVTPSKRKNWSLASKTDLAVNIQKGIIPLDMKKWNFKDIVFQATANLERAEIHHGAVGGYSLNHLEFGVISANNLEVSYKGEIRGKEATQLEGNFSITPDKEVLFQTLTKSFPVSLIEMVSPQIADQLNLFFGKNVDLALHGTYRDEEFDTQFNINSTQLQLNGSFNGVFPEYSFDVKGKASIHGEKAKLIGSSLDIEMAGDFGISESSLVIPLLNGRLFNDQVDIEIRGKAGKQGEPFQYEDVEIVANGHIKKLLTLEKYPIQDGLISLHVDGSKNSISGRAQGSFDQEFSDFHFEMKDFIKENKLDLAGAKTGFDFKLSRLPVVLINPFIPEVELNSLIGEFANLNGKGKIFWEKNPLASLDIEASASGFSSNFSLEIDKNYKISLNKPGHLHWEMSPERYESLLSSFYSVRDYHPEYLLVKTAPVDLKISKLDCPALDNENIGGFLSKSGLDADVLIGSLVFKRKETNETFIVQDIAGSIKGEDICHSVNLNLEGNLSSPQVPQNHDSTFSLSGQILNLCTGMGKFNHEKMTFKGELSLELLPVRQLTEVIPMDDVTRKKIQAILGELVNARIYGEISHMTGPLTIDIKASNFKALLPLQLTPNAIYLRDFVNAEITFTEEINETFIKDINPIILAGAYSDHPVKLYIDPKGFVLPIRPYFLQGLQIENAIIDIGKIRVRNGGQIQSMMEFLKVADVTPDRMMDAWFTPIYMSLRGGVASYKRFDMLLASSVHIALWGSVNLITDQVNMVLGFSPSTLQQKLNIGLPKQELFQIKMRGTTDKLDLDWSSATTRIGVLIAKSKGGPGGLIIGGIIEKFLGEEISPPPTTSPFPWEG